MCDPGRNSGQVAQPEEYFPEWVDRLVAEQIHATHECKEVIG